MSAPRYPEASWRPLGAQTQRPLARHDLIILHTMVMSLWDCDAYFRGAGFTGTEAHFGVGHDGETLQWQDLDFSADANLDAWDRAISIETADRGTGFPDWDPNDGSAVPAWTGAQVDRLAHLVAWLSATFHIPCELVPDSLPHRRGIAWHRQGVESNPAHLTGYRVPGGELWSRAVGKACPGWRRIAQIPEIVHRARQIVAGAGSARRPTPEEEDDMITALVRPGERVRIPVGTATVVALAHDAPTLDEEDNPIPYRAYVDATDLNDVAYKPEAWAPFYDAANRIAIPAGRTSVSPLREGSRPVGLHNDTAAVISVSLWRPPAAL